MESYHRAFSANSSLVASYFPPQFFGNYSNLEWLENFTTLVGAAFFPPQSSFALGSNLSCCSPPPRQHDSPLPFPLGLVGLWRWVLSWQAWRGLVDHSTSVVAFALRKVFPGWPADWKSYRVSDLKASCAFERPFFIHQNRGTWTLTPPLIH